MHVNRCKNIKYAHMHSFGVYLHRHTHTHLYMYLQRTAVQGILNWIWKSNIQELHSFYKNSWRAIPAVKLHQVVNDFQGQGTSRTEISDQLQFQCQFTASHHLLTQPLCTPLPQLSANLRVGHKCSNWPHHLCSQVLVQRATKKKLHRLPKVEGLRGCVKGP